MKLKTPPSLPSRRSSLVVWFLLLACSISMVSADAPFRNGDVFAGIGNGLVQHYDPNGQLLDILDTLKGVGTYTTGCAFDSAGNLYVTTFNAGDVVRFSGPEVPHQHLGSFGSGYSGSPESILFDALGNVFVGAVDGDNDLRKFDADGNPVAQFDVIIEDRGLDWIDLSLDQRTMFYTSEGRRILRYDVSTSTQLPDFTSTLPGSVAYALRILPDGGILVADTQYVVRLDSSASVVQLYDAPGEDAWFSLNLDPDGTSFWAGDFLTGRFHKFDIDAGGAPLLTVDTGAGPSRLYGICVYEEVTTALLDQDGDGLRDDWEENGFDYDGDATPDVDLPAMGAQKDHKDVFVQVDWLEEPGLFGHSHRPGADSIDKVVAAFAQAPVDNPDGVQGVRLHVLYGQAIEETNATREIGLAADQCGYDWAEFASLKDSRLPPERWPIFHYVIHGHNLPHIPCLAGRPTGVSRNGATFQDGASDFIVALGDLEHFLFGIGLPGGVVNARAGTFMHELGHNLGLGHGGLELDATGAVLRAEHTNHKPNHLSVMNYSFTSRGIRKKGGLFNLFFTAHFDYSRFGAEALPDLNEQDLNEPDGLNGTSDVDDYGTVFFCEASGNRMEVDDLSDPVDWNCDGDPDDISVTTNLNQDDDASANPVYSTLTTVNEWPHLRYKGGAVGVFGPPIVLPTVTWLDQSPEITFEQDLEQGPLAWNSPPRADAGPDQVIQCLTLGPYQVTLDGSNSSDPESDPITYSWTGPFPEGSGMVQGVGPTVSLPVGLSTIQLVVNDGLADSPPDEVEISIQDLEPPVLSAELRPLPRSGVEGPDGDWTCWDEVDNDADGLVDSADPDCQPSFNREGEPGDPSCDDEIDNDHDGRMDSADPDCYEPQIDPEVSVYRVRVRSRDACDGSSVSFANITLPCGSVPISSGVVIRFEEDANHCLWQMSPGYLEIRAPSLVLDAWAVDEVGNRADLQVSPDNSGQRIPRRHNLDGGGGRLRRMPDRTPLMEERR